MGMHVFSNGDGPCTKCSATGDMLFNKDFKYYATHVKTFRAELNADKLEKVAATFTPAENKPQVNKPQVNAPQNVVEWKINQAPIIELAKLTHTNINILYNIGLLEGVVIDTVLSGVNNPSDKVDADDTVRIMRMEAYMNMFMIEYELLRNGSTLNMRIDEFMKKHTDVDFSKFPDVHDKYVQPKFTDANELFRFMLQSFATALLKIYHSSETGPAGKDFVKYIMGKVVHTEKITSNPGTLHGKLMDSLDDDDDEGDAIDGDLDDKNADISAEDYDPFSFENSGIDEQSLKNNLNPGD